MIYPNPIIDQINIKGDFINDMDYTILIVSLSGQTVSKMNTTAENNEIHLDINNFSSGVYYLEVLDKNNLSITRQKLFKQ